MSMENHIKRLAEEHRKLDHMIHVMEQTGSYEDADIQHFKKKRLALKDEITRLQKPTAKTTK